jgi:flagellar hook-length control protein FliK
MLNMRPGEGPGAVSGPVKPPAGAANGGNAAAGAPFRIPTRAAADGSTAPATGFRPAAGNGNTLPSGDVPGRLHEGLREGLQGLLPGDTAEPAAASARQILEQAAARLGGEAGGVGADTLAGSDVSPVIPRPTVAGGVDPAAAAVAANTDGAALLPADLLPDLELEFPAAPLQPQAPGLALTPPPLEGPVADAFRGLAAATGSPGGAAYGAGADPLTGLPAGMRLPEWAGVAPGAAGATVSTGLPGLAAGAGDNGASGAANGTAGASPADLRAAAEAAGLASRNSQPLTPAVTPGPNGLAGTGPAMAAQLPPGADALAGLRQAMADLSRDGGASDRRPVPEPLTRTDGAGFLSTLGLTTASQAAGDRPVFMLPSPPGTPEFADQVAERVVWMAGQKLDRAQIRLNPAHLGPISVDVSVGEDGANITFTAQHAMTRDALEQALPRLREMFSGSGLALAGADVAGQGPDTRQGEPEGSAAGAGDSLTAAGTDGAADAAPVAETPVPSHPGGRGLIDTYV